MRDLNQDPHCLPRDLGAPIPDSPHAVSACLPTWADNVGYEEQDPRVTSRLTTGYPRFVYNRFCRELFATYAERFAAEGETCQAYPTESAARRCAEFLRRTTGATAGIHAIGFADVHAVSFPQSHVDIAKSYWQHTGEGVSSRLAEACLNAECGMRNAERSGSIPHAAPFAAEKWAFPHSTGEVKALLRKRVADEIGTTADNVWLFPCGMAAIFTLHRAILELFPDRCCVQFGFPYVDTLKIQQKFGPGTRFLAAGDAADLRQLADIAASEPIAALYTEFPSNPLLRSPDLARLAELSRRHGFPLLVDDTIAGFRNVDVLPLVDAVTSSLTKFFSGAGDVTAGSLVLNPDGPHYTRLGEWLHRYCEDLLWDADALVLAQNSVDYADRMRDINRNAERLAEFLRGHPRVARVYYPKFETPEHYRACLKPGGGYSGLLSIDLVDAARNAPPFYDRLRVSKGPNLGTNFTLACPYTILAHYRELEWAESCGVSRYLIRVSVGREDAEELIARFDEALAQCV